ncbi:sugar ABC transporter ATP-binding protein [Pseudoxanthobacter sp.]|uniref:sugar ABC transporter ATP-binding protein n=1 Tax=Pseudoxanthobacter sp. TaxID=1925742 RepID=UPI002FE18FEC
MYQLIDVVKSFPGVKALKGISLTIGRGEIVGLVGENGAGKSTLMKIISGAYRPDAGEIRLNGQPVRFDNARQAMDRGIGMVFQEQSTISNLSVMENIFLGFEKPFVRRGVIDWKAMAAAARKQLAKVRLDIDPATITGTLSFAERQLVELAKVLTLEERVEGDLIILLDEPTSVLSRAEVEMLFALVRDLRSRASFIFVSHRLDEVMDISDRIYVFRDGEVAAEMTKAEADVETIQHRMVGRDIDKHYYREHRQHPYDAGTVLLEADGLSQAGHYRNVSFALHAGEVLSLVGTEGSGREAIMRTLFGLERPHLGAIRIKGAPAGRLSARESVARGMAYVPRERKVEGIVAGMSVMENITLPQLARYSRGGVLRHGAERDLAREWIGALSIKAPSEAADCGTLSGGNQQKVVLAKWRSAGADIILLDHPTRGLDIGAKEDVYDMVRAMCADGCGVILIADTLEEAIGLSHTILVVRDGDVRRRFDCAPGAKPTLYDLVHDMV